MKLPENFSANVIDCDGPVPDFTNLDNLLIFKEPNKLIVMASLYLKVFFYWNYIF